MLTEEVVLKAPDRPDTLRNVFGALARAHVETLGLATERYTESGGPFRRIRFLFRDRTEGAAALKNEGYSVRVNQVVYLQVEASVARLDWAIHRLDDAGIKVETVYHAYAPGGPGLVIVCENAEKASEIL
ncbi:MAG: hypothetical protein R3185_09110 [Candidatus Thermoplasmatota archaeon]|nr:hypothetical protein [Candidatus Thermoplasmatota archaeon]